VRKTDLNGRKSQRQLRSLKGMPPDDDDDYYYTYRSYCTRIIAVFGWIHLLIMTYDFNFFSLFGFDSYCCDRAIGSLKSVSEPFRWTSFWWDSESWARWNFAEALSTAAVVQSAACQCHAWTAGICCCYLSVICKLSVLYCFIELWVLFFILYHTCWLYHKEDVSAYIRINFKIVVG